MLCSNCGSDEIRVVSTTVIDAATIRRYRQCRECFHNFVTHEVKTIEIITRLASSAVMVSVEEFEKRLDIESGKNGL